MPYPDDHLNTGHGIYYAKNVSHPHCQCFLHPWYKRCLTRLHVKKDNISREKPQVYADELVLTPSYYVVTLWAFVFVAWDYMAHIPWWHHCSLAVFRVNVRKPAWKFHRGYIQINPKSLASPSPPLGFSQRDKCLFQAALGCVYLHTNLYLYLDITTDVMHEWV